MSRARKPKKQAEPVAKPASIQHFASSIVGGRTSCGLDASALLPDHAVEVRPDPMRVCLTCETIRRLGYEGGTK